MIQIFFSSQHLVILFEPNDLNFYHYRTLQQEYPEKLSYVCDLVLKGNVFLAKSSLLIFKK